MVDKAKIIDRIRKLRALAADPAALGHEGRNAGTLANRLMAKHGITVRDLAQCRVVPEGLAPGVTFQEPVNITWSNSVDAGVTYTYTIYYQ